MIELSQFNIKRGLFLFFEKAVKKKNSAAEYTAAPQSHFLRMSDKFLDLGSLADSFSDVVELSTADFTLTDNVNLDYMGRMKRESLFNTAAISYAANSKCLGNAAAVTRDNGSFVHLDSFAGTFFDKVVYTNGVTDVEGRYGFLQLLTCKNFELVHFYSSFLDS